MLGDRLGHRPHSKPGRYGDPNTVAHHQIACEKRVTKLYLWRISILRLRTCLAPTDHDHRFLPCPYKRVNSDKLQTRRFMNMSYYMRDVFQLDSLNSAWRATFHVAIFIGWPEQPAPPSAPPPGWETSSEQAIEFFPQQFM